MKKIILPLCLILASCGSTDNSVSTDFVEAKNPQIQLDPAKKISDYSQRNYNMENQIPHVNANYEFTEVFSRSIGSADTGFNMIISPPVIYNDIIYTLDGYSKITATNLKTSQKLWSKTLCQANGVFKSAGLSATQNGIFVSLGNGKIFAIKHEDGEIIWEKKLEKIIKSAPIADTNNIYIQTISNDLLTFNQKTGKKTFTFNGIGQELNSPFAPTPSIKGNDVVIGMSSGNLYLLKKDTGVLIWGGKNYSLSQTRQGLDEKNIIASPVFDSNSLYAISVGNLFAKYNSYSGKIIWKNEISGTTEPLISGNTVFVNSTSNTLYAINSTTGKIIWKSSLIEQVKERDITFSPFCLVNNQLLTIGSNNIAYIFSTNSGKLISKKDIGNTTLTAPVCLSNELILLTPNADIVVYK